MQLQKFNGPWPAPAKLNLMLRILKRRTDGYHELQTVFQFIDYCDSLYFQIRTDGQIMRSHESSTITATQDLTLRAAHALQAATGCAWGVDIYLEKKLPIGGGLGGGSSDAATTLVALNQLWKLQLSLAELMQIGLKLGADVPVFIGGTAAWGEGVGERLTSITLPQPWYLVIVPNCQISTAQIFNAPELTRNSKPITTEEFLAGNQINDCTTAVRQLYPEVAHALDWLNNHLLDDSIAKLTGTGACVFAAFHSQPEALQILKMLPTHWQGFVAQGLNHSPLITHFYSSHS